MQYNFCKGAVENGKAGKQAAVPSWEKAAKKWLSSAENPIYRTAKP